MVWTLIYKNDYISIRIENNFDIVCSGKSFEERKRSEVRLFRSFANFSVELFFMKISLFLEWAQIICIYKG